MNIVHEVVFFDELFEDVAQFDSYILGLVQRCLGVENFNVEIEKLGTLTVKDTVEKKIDDFEGNALGSDVVSISDVLACNSDASAIGIRLLVAKITNNL